MWRRGPPQGNPRLPRAARARTTAGLASANAPAARFRTPMSPRPLLAALLLAALAAAATPPA
ncbi:MAG: hypothetical protein ACKOUK_01770, partial [Verrucomicrobiota bacterium]